MGIATPAPLPEEGGGNNCVTPDNTAFFGACVCTCVWAGGQMGSGGRDKDVCTCNVVVAVLGLLSPMSLLLSYF